MSSSIGSRGREPCSAPDHGIVAALLDALSGLGVWLIAFDPDGNCRLCSEGACDLLGAPLKNKADLIDAIAFEKPVTVRRRLEERLFRISNEPSSERVHMPGGRVVRLDMARVGSERSQLDVVIIRDDSSESDHIQDMTRLNRMANLGQAAAGASHEFNNNLTSVLGWAQIAILNTDATSPTYQALEIIADNAKKAKRIFTRLLDRSHPEIEQRREKVSLARVVDDVLTLLHFEMKHAGIEVVRSGDAQGTCLVDEDAMGQVFVNIIRNAIDVLKGGGRIEVDVKQCEDTIDVAIKDSGPGIPEEVIGRVFDNFFSTKREDDAESNGGTGLGLTISLDIVRQHGGDIRVDSTPGHGARFTVSLPIADKGPPREKDEGGGARPTIPPGAVVLVVDDEPDVGEMIRTSLELQGISVLSVKSGEEAVSECERLRFDAAFVDYSMPGLSGHDLGLKLLEVQPSMPIIFMSGLTVKKNSVAEDFLKKPFDLDEIRATLYRVLKRRKDGTASNPP